MSRVRVAKIERYKPRLMRTVEMLSASRAKLDCGCQMIVGIHPGASEPAATGVACSEAHQPLVDLATQLLTRNLEHPAQMELVKVCADLLTAAGHATGEC
jgi:hypothetical protein